MATCYGCGGFVTDDYARVFGDNDDKVDDCRNCSKRRIESDDEDETEKRTVLLSDIEGRETPAEPETEPSSGVRDHLSSLVNTLSRGDS